MVSTLLFAAVALAPPQESLRAHAMRLHTEVPLIDGHNDLPWSLREIGIDGVDLRVRGEELQTDIIRLREGGVGAQFWSVWVPTGVPYEESHQTVQEQIAMVKAIVAKYPATFEMAYTAGDIWRAFPEQIASLIGMEGGHSLGEPENALDNLRKLYNQGARYMTLTHSINTEWADSATDEPEFGGLAPLGEEIVREMNRLGMLVDLSHVHEETMKDALRITKAPVIFSHSGVRAIGAHPRNVPDSVLPLVKKNGGVIMVVIFKSYLSTPWIEWSKAGKVGPEPVVDLEVFCDHIDHIARTIGVDHIGIGSDFDGGGFADDLNSVADFPKITMELIRRGYTDTEIKKILGYNVIRVMREAEAVARQLKE